MTVGAYVPCFNNAVTIRRAVESVMSQSVPPRDVVVVDDGSTDGSIDVVRPLGVRVVRHESNLGRGAARARAMRELSQPFVLCCDATNVLDATFVERALPWFEERDVAAVFGRLTQAPPTRVAERWRGRHLLKMQARSEVHRRGVLATYGALVRASAVAAAGGYDVRLRHTEDADLGARLLARSYDVVSDPRLQVTCIATNTLPEVLERYWRWYAGARELVSWTGYRKNIGYSIAMARMDLRDRDPLSALISVACPHYQFWRSWMRGRRRAHHAATVEAR